MSNIEEIKELKELIPEFIAELKPTNNKTNQELSTGFYDLDNIIIGLHNATLNVIASRPAMGKTSLALNIATNVAKKKKVPVAIFSYEMSKYECISRIMSLETMIPNSKFRERKLDDKDLDKIDEATMKLSDTEIYIDDRPSSSIKELEEKCRKLKIEKNIGLIVIDYIQLIPVDKKDSREQELSDITITLKNLAKELDIPILVTSKLSRETEKRYDKGKDPRPILEDLKYTLTIIQDADVILFLYRDNYYYLDSAKGDIAEIRVAKNKFGNLGTAELLWLSEYMKFANLDK